MSKKAKIKKLGKAGLNTLLYQRPTQGKLVDSGIEAGMTLLIGLVGAGLGKAFGRPSALVGLGTAYAGFYFGQPRLQSLGLGMVAGGSLAGGSLKGVDGAEVSGLEGAKERLKEFGEDLKHRFYLDKIIKQKSVSGIEGLGNVEYFKYPQQQEQLNMGALDAIENEIAGSGEEFGSQFAGAFDDPSIMGVEDDPIY